MRLASWMAVLVLGMVTAAALAEEVRLTTGEVLRGQVISRDGKTVVIQHAFLGRLTIPSAQVVAINMEAPTAATQSATRPVAAPLAAEDPASLAAKAPTTVPTSSPATQPATISEDLRRLTMAATQPAGSLFENWKARLELGFSGESGLSDVFSGRLGFLATKVNLDERWKVDAAYFNTLDRGNTTRNDVTTGVLKDWLFTPHPWFWWADGRFDYDQFKSWRQRASGHTGPGFAFIDTENVKFITRVGGGVKKEWGSIEGDIIPEGFAGLDYAWKVTSRQTLAATSTFFPSLEQIDQFRARSTADWTLKLDQADGLSLKFGIVHEYESQSDLNINKNDLKYFGALVFEF